MKFFGKIKKQNENGYKIKIYFCGIPVAKKVRDVNTRRLYLFGIKIYHKNFLQPKIITNQVINTVYDSSSRFITEILNKALETQKFTEYC